MKYAPHYFKDLLDAIKQGDPVELSTVVNVMSAFCRGVEDNSLEKIIYIFLQTAERGLVEQSIRNLEFLNSESTLAAEHGSKIEAHNRLSDEIKPDTIRKIIKAADNGEGIGLALFVERAKSGKEIDPEVRKIVIEEIAKIRALLLSKSGKGRDLRGKFSTRLKVEWNIADIGKSEKSVEILEDFATYRNDGLSKTEARMKAGKLHGLSVGAVTQLQLRSTKAHEQSDAEYIKALTKTRADGQPETTIEEDVFKSVLEYVAAGRPDDIAFELVGQRYGLLPSSIKKIFNKAKKHRFA